MGAWREAFRCRPFLVSLVLLGGAAVAVQAAQRLGGVSFRKAAVPLRKPLSEFDFRRIAPYRLVKTLRLPGSVEKELGTTDYLEAVIEDPTLSGPGEPGRRIDLFVTYYTGGVDQVPHVPEECYVGGGYDILESSTLDLTVPGVGLPDDRLEVRRLLFQSGRSGGEAVRPVLYFFMVNGSFVSSRTAARVRLADVRYKHAYFSKVELAFQNGAQPDGKQSTALAAKLLTKVLPVLVADHWPTPAEAATRPSP